MPKPSRLPNLVHQHLLGGLIETRPVSWTKKTLVPATSISKETVEKTTVTHRELKFPLAQNVSEENVDRAAKRWIA